MTENVMLPETLKRPSPRSRIVVGILAVLRQVDLVVWILAAWYAGGSSGRPEVGLTVVVLALVVLLPRQLPGDTRGRLRTRLLLGLALASLTATAGRDLERFATTPWVRSWNVFHYYLGAEYFGEVGYDDLYPAALAADAEGDDVWRRIDEVRDQHSYRIESREKATAGYRPEEHFSPERWTAFRTDVAALAAGMKLHSWRGVFVDRGYNATPFWTAVGKVLTSAFPASQPAALKILCALDLALLAAALIFVGRTFGTRAAALVLLLLTLSPVNSGRLAGGFLQYDWFSAFALGICFYRRKQPVAAAGGLAYAALARIFPGMLVVSAAIPVLWSWWRESRTEPKPAAAGSPALARLRRWSTSLEGRFAVAFAGWCLAGVIVGSLTPRGPAAWVDFAGSIRHHAEEHVVGERRVGLEHLFTRDLDSPEERPSLSERRRTLEEQRMAYSVAAVALLGLWAAVVWRRRPEDALLLGLVVVFALTVSSRYYWSYLALLPLLGNADHPRRAGPRWIAAGQVAVFAAFFAFSRGTTAPYATYWLLNALLTAYFVVLLLAYLVRDLRGETPEIPRGEGDRDQEGGAEGYEAPGFDGDAAGHGAPSSSS